MENLSNPNDPDELIDAIIFEKYRFLRNIKSHLDIDWPGFEVIRENVLRISNGLKIEDMAYFPEKDKHTPAEILQIQTRTYNGTADKFKDVIEVLQTYLSTNDITLLQTALDSFTKQND